MTTQTKPAANNIPAVVRIKRLIETYETYRAYEEDVHRLNRLMDGMRSEYLEACQLIHSTNSGLTASGTKENEHKK